MCRKNRLGGLLIQKRIILAEPLIEQEMRRIITRASIMTIHLMKRQVVFSNLFLSIGCELVYISFELCCFSAIYRIWIKSIKKKMDTREVEIGDEVEGKNIVVPMVMVAMKQTFFF